MVRFYGLVMVGVVVLNSDAAAAETPNFVLINIDDMGYADVGAFGSRLNRTPNIDRLAAAGTRFTAFYAAPVCSPSRSSLMTGCYPKRVGIPNVLFPGNAIGIHHEEHTVAELLKKQGYATMCIGKWHLGDQPEFLPTRHGFDHYFGIPYSNDMGPVADGARGRPGEVKAARAAKKKNTDPGHPPIPLMRDEQVLQIVKAEDQERLVEWYTDEAVKFLREQKDRSFFLYLPHSAVHFPIYPGPKFRGKSPHGEYSDWVEEVDWSVGRIIETLRELKLTERTLVLFTSDNGGTPRAVNTPLRGNKASIWEGGMRVPTIVSWPGRISAGASSDAIASMMDVLPTFVKLAGGQVPTDRKIDGTDLWPVLTNPSQANSSREAFYYFRITKLEAVRSGDWKLQLDGPKLYNLKSDIGETKDVAAENAEVVARLQTFVETMRDDLGLDQNGPGCRPPGRVQGARPLIDHGGQIRAGFPAKEAK